jgi:hypothetical protein
MANAAIEDVLLRSEDPSIVYKTRLALGEAPEGKRMRTLRAQVQNSPRVKTLLGRRDKRGHIACGKGVYAKWQGAHWIMASLADLGYPEADESLVPVRDQILDCWLAERFYVEFQASSKAEAYKRDGVPVLQGRHRCHASQQGNALYYLVKLGLDHERLSCLSERLLHWRWPDGGWNCDKNPSACHSTFIHTLHAMRGLHWYGRRFRDQAALNAAKQASEIFLSRRLYKRRTNGAIIKKEFVRLHYPLYWHYDILQGLKVLAEMDLLRDPRCADALDLLESKRLPDGGWPAESAYYSVSETIKLGADYVNWGGTSQRRMNPWVTADAMAVLRQAGRWPR